MSRVSRRLFTVLAAWAVVSCLSPTLPLPPPSEPEVSTVGEGLVRLEGEVPEPEGIVLARNRRTDVIAGTIADRAGRYDFTLSAEVGDVVRLWYVGDDVASDTRDFMIPADGLPVPAVPALGWDDSGRARLSGTLERRLAPVFVRNVESGAEAEGVSDTQGEYVIVIEAESGDTLELWYRFGSEQSEVIRFTAE